MEGSREPPKHPAAAGQRGHRTGSAPALRSPAPGLPLGGNGVIALGDIGGIFFFLCVCFFYFIFIFFSLPFISPHLKKAPDHRRQLAAAHAPSWAPAPCSTRAGWDPQNPVLGMGGGSAGQEGSCPRLTPAQHPQFLGDTPRDVLPRCLRAHQHGERCSTSRINGGGGSRLCPPPTHSVHPIQAGWSRGLSRPHGRQDPAQGTAGSEVGAVGSWGVPQAVPRGPSSGASTRTELAGSRQQTSSGRWGKA